MSETTDWFSIEPQKVQWLVDGLIPSDGYTAIVGKPKAGKSTFLRSLIASVIKNKKFLGRAVEVPEGQGRVLYIHLDRKDVPWRVASELRDKLGITKEESSRLHLYTSDNVPDTGYQARLDWLKDRVMAIQPNVVVIDLLWQFTCARNSNDYKEVLDAINQLQEALRSVQYQGSLIVTMHARKATNADDEADDIIGSTAQRGSFANGIHLSRDRKSGHYTIMTDQSLRDDVFGEIDKSVLIRNPDGSLELGQKVDELAKADKVRRIEEDLKKVLVFVAKHPGCEMSEIMGQLMMSKKTVLRLLVQAGDMFHIDGKGIKGDPLRYYVRGYGDDAVSPESCIQAAA